VDLNIRDKYLHKMTIGHTDVEKALPELEQNPGLITVDFINQAVKSIDPYFKIQNLLVLTHVLAHHNFGDLAQLTQERLVDLYGEPIYLKSQIQVGRYQPTSYCHQNEEILINILKNFDRENDLNTRIVNGQALAYYDDEVWKLFYPFLGIQPEMTLLPGFTYLSNEEDRKKLTQSQQVEVQLNEPIKIKVSRAASKKYLPWDCLGIKEYSFPHNIGNINHLMNYTQEVIGIQNFVSE
jgi:hypothetical protein